MKGHSVFKKEKIGYGFTLIELTVVVAIIGLLSSIIYTQVDSARGKARDAKRIHDLKQIQTAIELFYAKYGHYPNNSENGIPLVGEIVGDDLPGVQLSSFEDAIREFMPKVPGDPLYTKGYNDDGIYYYSYDPKHGTWDWAGECTEYPGVWGQYFATLCFHTSESGAYKCSEHNETCGSICHDAKQHLADYCILFVTKGEG